MRIKRFLPLFLSLVFIAFVAVVVSIVKKFGYHITYCVTASIPRGFYLIVPIKKIERYDIVEFIPPLDALNFVMQQHWVPQSGLLLKYVFAVPGDDVCICNERVLVNKKNVGKVYRFYSPGKALPQTKFCGKLKSNQYFVFSDKKEHSFDGRYFGIISADKILGRATPIKCEADI